MKVAALIARTLAAEGIDKIMVVQGAANNDLIYAIADLAPDTGNVILNENRGKFTDYVCFMHEQAAGFAAEGFAKARGGLGCAVVTSGPGGQNLLTAIANCYYDSVPCIFITGQVNSKFMRKSPTIRQVGFQEWPATEVLGQVCKYSALVTEPGEVLYELQRAIHVAKSGRPGPVLLDIPLDVQRVEVNPDNLFKFERELQPYRQKAHNQTIEFIRDLAAAKRPVLLVGGGCQGREAREALRPLCEALRIPVFPTWNALDVVPSDDPWYAGRIGTYGGAGRNFGVQNSDLLLAVGCRLSGRITGGVPETFAREAKRYVVDVDGALLMRQNQQLPFHVNIKSEAAEFMATLEYLLRQSRIGGEERPSAHEEWFRQCQDWRTQYDPVREAYNKATGWQPGDGVHPYAFARKLSEMLPSDAIIVSDCGGNVVVMNHAFEVKRGQRYFTNNGNSPMGFSYAAALGAALAEPQRPVICVIGDGGFNMHIQELQTMKNYGLKVKTFILDNRIYGITKSFQENHYPGRYEACGPKGYKPPDFAKIVTSGYGIRSMKMQGNEDIELVISSALAYAEEGVVCVVESPEFHQYEPRIVGWATPIEDMSPLLPRDEFRRNMMIDPALGWETGGYK